MHYHGKQVLPLKQILFFLSNPNINKLIKLIFKKSNFKLNSYTQLKLHTYHFQRL